MATGDARNAEIARQADAIFALFEPLPPDFRLAALERYCSDDILTAEALRVAQDRTRDEMLATTALTDEQVTRRMAVVRKLVELTEGVRAFLRTHGSGVPDVSVGYLVTLAADRMEWPEHDPYVRPLVMCQALAVPYLTQLEKEQRR